MSSGQKAWADEREEAAHAAHIKQLEALGYSCIANLIDDMSDQLRYFEADNPSLPRASWGRLDQIKAQIRMLK